LIWLIEESEMPHPTLVRLLPDEMKQRLADGVCIGCGHAFSEENVHSDAGWREVKLSNMCEDCFDALFADEE
jgi:hypothetical protein